MKIEAQSQDRNAKSARRVMITRPYRDGVLLAEQLSLLGMVPLIEPMIEITAGPDHLSPDLRELSGCQAMVLTSANGAESLAGLIEASPLTTLTVFAVGEATAAAARAIGFLNIKIAAGDSESLIALIADSLDPQKGWLAHVCGSVVAGDIKGELESQGFKLNRFSLYTATEVASLSHGGRAALKAGDLDSVLFFSPRTARIFEQRVAEAGLSETLHGVEAICLSAAVAEACQANYRRKSIAETPDLRSLLTLMAGEAAHRLFLSGSSDPESSRDSTTTGRRWINRLAAVLSALILIVLAVLAVLWARPDLRLAIWEYLPSGWQSAPTAAPIDPPQPSLKQSSSGPQDQSAEPSKEAEWQARFKALEAQMGSQGQGLRENQKQLQALNSEVTRLSRQKSTARDRGSARIAILAIAATELSAAVSRGESLAPGLATLRGLKDWNQAGFTLPSSLFDKLEPIAATGVLRLNQLSLEFPTHAHAAVKAYQAQNHTSFWQKFKAVFARLIMIRHTTGARPGSLDERLTRAEALLQQGDLAATVELVEALPEITRPSFEPWLIKARQRLEAEAVVAELTRLMVKELEGNP
ncbi:MAG: uroporphyrinogen-III synthase [Candidatus Pacebacteria bacterium]|nr:uroporphyrinogen-III synthase [Candidatus Paceibacterota bacterium]